MSLAFLASQLFKIAPAHSVCFMVVFSFLPPILFHFLQRDILSDLATESRRDRLNEMVRRLMFVVHRRHSEAEEASRSSAHAGEVDLPRLWCAQRIS